MTQRAKMTVPQTVDGAAARRLARAEGFRSHTVQWMPDPERFEVIYCTAPRCGQGGVGCARGERCGNLEGVIHVEPSGLRLERVG